MNYSAPKTSGLLSGCSQKIVKIAEFLNEQPKGVGKPITIRAAWDKVNSISSIKNVVVVAEQLIQTPIPVMTDEIYLQYSTVGNRQIFDKTNHDRCYRLDTFTQAECIEDKGRFIQGVEEILIEICNQKSWVLSAHDKNLDNFYGRDITIDLHASAIAWRMTTCLYLLEPRLSEDVINMVIENIERRVFNPFEKIMEGEHEMPHWINVENNWNACCLGAVLGAALTLISSKMRRAYYIAAYEKYITYYLNGFTEDGYCSEGLGYWNYGFEHFLDAIEFLYQETNGQIDYCSQVKVAKCSMYAKNIRLQHNQYPAIADCDICIKPNIRNLYIIQKRYGFQMIEETDITQVFYWDTRLYSIMTVLFLEERHVVVEGISSADNKLRSWFSKAGIVISRPCRNEINTMTVLMKAGNNHEHHNHNDVGTFIISIGDYQPITDVGAEIYTSRTFSEERYESKVLNSYGHSVPVVAETLQSPYVHIDGSEGKALDYCSKVIETSFSDDEDRFTIDLSNLYEVKELEKLTRQFTYQRSDKEIFTVCDRVEFSSPQSFESAIITLSSDIHATETGWIIGDDMKVKISVESDISYEFKTNVIKENTKHKKDITRLAIKTKRKINKGTIKYTIQLY